MRQDYYFYWASPNDRLPPWLIPLTVTVLGETWLSKAPGDYEILTSPRWIRWRRGDIHAETISAVDIETILNGGEDVVTTDG